MRDRYRSNNFKDGDKGLESDRTSEEVGENGGGDGRPETHTGMGGGEGRC